ncbi:MAG: hypothetical protein ACLUKN_14820 [Bacilli bacterium]
MSILMAGYGTQVLDGSVDISGFSEIKGEHCSPLDTLEAFI